MDKSYRRTSIQWTIYYTARKRYELVVHATTQMNFKIIMLSERSQMKKNTHCMIAFMYNSCKWQLIYSARKQISDWAQVGEGKRQGLLRGIRKLLGIMDIFTILIVVMGSLFIPMSRLIKLCTLNMWHLLHVICTSTKLVKKIRIYR